MCSNSTCNFCCVLRAVLRPCILSTTFGLNMGVTCIGISIQLSSSPDSWTLSSCGKSSFSPPSRASSAETFFLLGEARVSHFPGRGTKRRVRISLLTGHEQISLADFGSAATCGKLACATPYLASRRSDQQTTKLALWRLLAWTLGKSKKN